MMVKERLLKGVQGLFFFFFFEVLSLFVEGMGHNKVVYDLIPDL